MQAGRLCVGALGMEGKLGQCKRTWGPERWVRLSGSCLLHETARKDCSFGRGQTNPPLSTDSIILGHVIDRGSLFEGPLSIDTLMG